MTMWKEESLTAFDFWAGAKDTIKELTLDEIEQIEAMLEELDTEGEGMSETEINDFFWFERDTIAEWLGYNDFEEIMKRNVEEG